MLLRTASLPHPIARASGRTNGTFRGVEYGKIVLDAPNIGGSFDFYGLGEVEPSSSSFSMGGDSGALIVAPNQHGNHPVGLVVGGPSDYSLTYVCLLGAVLDSLAVDLE
jgi:hypothetical protein